MRSTVLLAACVALAACGSGSEMATSEQVATMEVSEPATADGSAIKRTAAQPLKIAIPQMAYVYGYAFRLPAEAVAKAQADHVALCDRLGPTRCQVLAMEGYASGSTTDAATLKLRVASSIARQFGAQLAAAIDRVGGRQISSTIAAEDVSKAIVDTEARLRQRSLLVERLTEILRTRKGTVAELVEAERSVASAQEEIDQAKGWLAELRGRVAMSVVNVRYDAVAAPGAAASGGIGDAVSQSSSAFLFGLSAILQLAIFAAPWAVIIGGAVWAVRRVRRRWATRQTAIAPD